MAVAAGYIIEQAILFTCAGVLLMAQVFQLWVESAIHPSARAQTVGKLKNIIHRITPFATVLLLVRCIDIWGVYGLLSEGALELVSDNTTALLASAVCAAVYLTIRSGYRIIARDPPAFIGPAAFATSCALFIFANLAAAAAFTGIEWLRLRMGAAWLYFLALSLSCIAITFNWAVINLRTKVLRFHDDAFSKYEPASGSPEEKTSRQVLRALQSLQVLQIGGTFIVVVCVAVEIYCASIKLQGNTSGMEIPDRSAYSFRPNSIFVWFQTLSIALLTWHAWIPLKAAESVGHVHRTESDHTVRTQSDATQPLIRAEAPGPAAESRGYGAPLDSNV